MKVGIITHYYQSQNYGGNLQAYALCAALQKLGYQAEQISLKRSRSVKSQVKTLLRKGLEARYVSVNRQLRRRKKAISGFNSGRIPHSPVYQESTVSQCACRYDAFITGSDQVWHPLACCDAYLLGFAPEDKCKLSYAASFSTDKLPEHLRAHYQSRLRRLQAISVREESALSLLARLSVPNGEVTLDPTLLLSPEEWLEIAEPCPVEEPYLFCYFLGQDPAQRALAQEFAKKHALKLVTLPHLLGRYRKCDRGFGDIPLYNVSPGQLLSLIRNAQYVFTDSFHVALFATLFDRQHFIFKRFGAEEMSVRILSLTRLFGTQARFGDEPEKCTLTYIDALPTFSFQNIPPEYGEKKRASIRFLQDHLPPLTSKEPTA